MLTFKGSVSYKRMTEGSFDMLRSQGLWSAVLKADEVTAKVCL
ncbi:hypothetical protein CECT5772_03394 [Streptococcus equi subsp. ruminatorum CECT 5772]|uniref:Uncharacterized protein n=1 Tax=Streptococcus equi subsp. ruminatorum CECT 5772 TaxID=1051981 RepID=A0A922NV44_9STRE|nr:hypothetical protein CECT5772_03394 [Streptococcus equi subsp. ruminatorum CECT 5772]